MKTTFYIPKGNWPLNFEVYSSFFKKLGYTQREDEGDFLVLPGGSDLGVRPNRDLFESQNYATYTAKRRPIAAICRGMQLSIVDDGGILIPHIPNVLEDIKHTTLTGHWKGQSTWHKTSLGFLTNSRHHQGFVEVPDKWSILDKTSDGVIEAATDKQTLAVQWHPEREEMWKTQALEWYTEELKNLL